MNKVDLFHKFECEVQKLYTPNRNMRTYNNLTSEEYKNLEFAKRQLLLNDPWCYSTAHGLYCIDSDYFHHTFPISFQHFHPYQYSLFYNNMIKWYFHPYQYSLFYNDMIKWYEYYFVESENDSLIERLHKNNRRSIMNTIIKRMEEPAK